MSTPQDPNDTPDRDGSTPTAPRDESTGETAESASGDRPGAQPGSGQAEQEPDSRYAPDRDFRYQPGQHQSGPDPYAAGPYQPDHYGSAPSASSGYQPQHQPHHQSGQQQHQPNQYEHQPYGGDPYRSGSHSPGQHPSGPYVAQQPGQSPYGAPEGQSGRGRKAGFFKSLFDFRFDNFIAVRWAGIIYVITVIVAALSWVATIISSIMVGIAAGAASNFYTGSFYDDSPSFSPWPLIFAILFGWIVPLLWVIFVRLVLELVVSSVKTAEHTKTIADSVGR